MGLYCHRKVPSCAYVAHPYVPPCAKGGYRMVHPCAKLQASMCQGGQVKVPTCAKLPIARSHSVQSCTSQVPLCAKLPIASHCVPSCSSQGAIVRHVTHRKVPLHAYIAHHKVPLHAYVAHHKVPSCGMMPITRCQSVQNLLCHGAIVWLRCPLPSAIGGYRMVPLCAKFPISCSHRVPMFPMSRCHRVPLSPIA